MKSVTDTITPLLSSLVVSNQNGNNSNNTDSSLATRQSLVNSAIFTEINGQRLPTEVFILSSLFHCFVPHVFLCWAWNLSFVTQPSLEVILAAAMDGVTGDASLSLWQGVASGMDVVARRSSTRARAMMTTILQSPVSLVHSFWSILCNSSPCIV
jgi:hypothetical protein